MSDTELLTPCPECLVVDQLGRHHAECPRAVRLGLERLAEGEDPILPEEEPDVPIVESDEGTAAADAEVIRAQVRDPLSMPDPPIPGLPPPELTCVGCGQPHAVVSDRRIGMMRIAPTCEWRLRYPDTEAWEVIEKLESEIKQAAAERLLHEEERHADQK